MSEESSIKLKLPKEVKQELSSMAAQSGLSVDRLVSVLLQGFIEGGGKVYTGPWTEGPGIRLLPDWPRFSSGMFKIKQIEMQ